MCRSQTSDTAFVLTRVSLAHADNTLCFYLLINFEMQITMHVLSPSMQTKTNMNIGNIQPRPSHRGTTKLRKLYNAFAVEMIVFAVHLRFSRYNLYNLLKVNILCYVCSSLRVKQQYYFLLIIILANALIA